MRRKQEIILFGEKVYLYERYTDVSFAFQGYVESNFANGNTINLLEDVALSLEVIKDSLSINIDYLNWFSIAGKRLICLQPFKYLKYKKIFSIKYLFKYLSEDERKTFLEIILFDIEKRIRKNDNNNRQKIKVDNDRLKWIVSFYTNKPFDEVGKMGVAQFNDCLNSIIAIEKFRRGEGLELTSEWNDHSKLESEHKRFFPHKWSVN
jgi:hypothetical protein